VLRGAVQERRDGGSHARADGGTYPHLTEIGRAVTHDEATIVGAGCDDQFEFEFALDLILDGMERLRNAA
jgi:hypothetical protein